MRDRFSVLHESKSDLDRLIVEISRSHKHTPDKTPLNEWSSRRRSRYLHKHERRTSTTSEWFEPAVPPVERLQTYALDGTAIVCRICVRNRSVSFWDNYRFRYVLQYLFHQTHINSSMRGQSFRHGTSSYVFFLLFNAQDLVFMNATVYSNSSPIFVYCWPVWNYDIRVCSRIKEDTSVV